MVKVSPFDDEKHYVATRFALVVLPSSLSDEVKVKRGKSLLDSLRRIYRLACVGTFALISWFGIQNAYPPSGMRVPVELTSIPESLFLSTAIPMLIIIVGLAVELLLSRKKRMVRNNQFKDFD